MHNEILRKLTLFLEITIDSASSDSSSPIGEMILSIPNMISKVRKLKKLLRLLLALIKISFLYIDCLSSLKE